MRSNKCTFTQNHHSSNQRRTDRYSAHFNDAAGAAAASFMMSCGNHQHTEQCTPAVGRCMTAQQQLADACFAFNMWHLFNIWQASSQVMMSSMSLFALMPHQLIHPDKQQTNRISKGRDVLAAGAAVTGSPSPLLHLPQHAISGSSKGLSA